MKRVLIIPMLAAAFAFALVSCGGGSQVEDAVEEVQQETSDAAEAAGGAIEEAVDEAADQLEQAGDAMQEMADDAVDAAEEAMDDAKDAMDGQ